MTYDQFVAKWNPLLARYFNASTLTHLRADLLALEREAREKGPPKKKPLKKRKTA